MSDATTKPIQPKRPGVATAAGIILIVYCSLSILSGVIGMFSTAITSCTSSLTDMASKQNTVVLSPSYNAMTDYYRDNIAILMVISVVNLGAGVTGLVAGIFLMGLKRKGPTVARIYTFIEFGALALSIVNAIMILPYTLASMDAIYSGNAFSSSRLPQGFGNAMSTMMQGIIYFGMAFGFLIGFAIPSLILIFVTRPKVTEFYSRYGK